MLIKQTNKQKRYCRACILLGTPSWLQLNDLFVFVLFVALKKSILSKSCILSSFVWLNILLVKLTQCPRFELYRPNIWWRDPSLSHLIRSMFTQGGGHGGGREPLVTPDRGISRSTRNLSRHGSWWEGGTETEPSHLSPVTPRPCVPLNVSLRSSSQQSLAGVPFTASSSTQTVVTHGSTSSRTVSIAS